jgi:hypothetical protein
MAVPWRLRNSAQLTDLHGKPTCCANATLFTSPGTHAISNGIEDILHP